MFCLTYPKKLPQVGKPTSTLSNPFEGLTVFTDFKILCNWNLFPIVLLRENIKHCLFFFRMRSFTHVKVIVPRETPLLFFFFFSRLFLPRSCFFCSLLGLFFFLSLFIPKNCALCYFTTVLTPAAFLQWISVKFFEGRVGTAWQAVCHHTSFLKDAWVFKVLHQHQVFHHTWSPRLGVQLQTSASDHSFQPSVIAQRFQQDCYPFHSGLQSMHAWPWHFQIRRISLNQYQKSLAFFRAIILTWMDTASALRPARFRTVSTYVKLECICYRLFFPTLLLPSFQLPSTTLPAMFMWLLYIPRAVILV